MPIYEFKCDNCGRKTEAINMPVGTDFIDCPDCGALTGRVLSNFAFPGSQKSWSGRKHVNFHVDTADEVYNKQLRLMVESGKKPKNCTTAQWNACLARHKKRADNTRPIRVVDEDKYGITPKPGKEHVEA